MRNIHIYKHLSTDIGMNNTRAWVLALFVFSGFFVSCSDTKNPGKRNQRQIEVNANTLIPTAMSDHWELIGAAVNEPGYDVWGSSPIRDSLGRVHLFCARWPSENAFDTGWRFKSEIAHYVCENPEGPFQFLKVVGAGKGNQKWNSAGFHNPNMKKIDEKYVLVYIANDGAEIHGPNQRIGMLSSGDLQGPWMEIPNENEPLLSPPTDSAIWCYESGCGVNNPSIIKHPNGKYYLYFKAMSGPRPQGKVSMGVAVSDQLEGPYVIQQKPITANDKVIEDGYAFLWRNHICLLTTDNHGILEEGGGLLWVSEDGLHFDSAPQSGFHHLGRYYLKDSVPENANPRYTRNVKFERPQLLMDDRNEPEYLYCPSGVALDGSDGTNCYVLKFSNKSTRRFR